VITISFSTANAEHKCSECERAAVAHWQNDEDAGYYCEEHVKPLLAQLKSGVKP